MDQIFFILLLNFCESWNLTYFNGYFRNTWNALKNWKQYFVSILCLNNQQMTNATHCFKGIYVLPIVALKTYYLNYF